MQVISLLFYTVSRKSALAPDFRAMDYGDGDLRLWKAGTGQNIYQDMVFSGHMDEWSLDKGKAAGILRDKSFATSLVRLADILKCCVRPVHRVDQL